jgi:hypothetical protein
MSAEKKPTPTQKPPTKAEAPKDIFDDVAALSKTVEEIAPSERIITSLQVRKPRKDEFIRIHPEIRVALNLYEDKEARVDYLIGPKVLEEVNNLVGVRRVLLSLAATYGGEYFAWPVPVPADVRANRWHATAFQGAEESARGWVRLKAATSEYEIYRRTINDAKAPKWPEEVPDTGSLLRLAFGAGGGGGEVINDPDHEILKRLRGES